MLKTSIFQSITRIDLSRSLAGHGFYWTTAYYVDEMLVDTGCAHTALELIEWLKDKSLSCIANTHTHEDHIGANGFLQRRNPALRILAHPLAISVLSDPRRTQPLQPYRRLFWGWPESSIARPVADGGWIETTHHRFQVLYTPGHCPDHLCLYEPGQGWLFTGDLFVGGQERALRAGYNIWQIIGSLKRIARLPVSVMFPGSARVRKNPASELTSKIAYLEDLGYQVLDLKRQGWTVEAIVRQMCGKPMLIEWVTLGNFSRRHLVLSYLDSSQE